MWKLPWQAGNNLLATLVANTDSSPDKATTEWTGRQHAHHCLLWKSSIKMRGTAGHQQSTGWWRAIFAGSRRARQAVTPTLDTSILSCTCRAQAKENRTRSRCCWWVLTGRDAKQTVAGPFGACMTWDSRHILASARGGSHDGPVFSCGKFNTQALLRACSHTNEATYRAPLPGAPDEKSLFSTWTTGANACQLATSPHDSYVDYKPSWLSSNKLSWADDKGRLVMRHVRQAERQKATAARTGTTVPCRCLCADAANHPTCISEGQQPGVLLQGAQQLPMLYSGMPICLLLCFFASVYGEQAGCPCSNKIQIMRPQELRSSQ